MSWLKFGTFLAPLHRLMMNPTLQIREDLDLVVLLDELGFDEAWFGEHHSGGAELFGSPELMIAAAAELTQRIKLGTGVNSLPYHHPFVIADRWVQLSHMTRGRAIFGAGPGSLPMDAWQMGIDVLEARHILEASLGAIVRLVEGETVTQETPWFTLRDANLQLSPYGGSLDMRVAAMASPSGPRAAGKYGTGMLSVAATTSAGFEALRGAWAIAEEIAAENDKVVDRSRWSIVAPMHLADTEGQAHRDVAYGLGEWVHYYKKLVPLPIGSDAEDVPGAIKELTVDTGMAVIGTPAQAIEMIERLVNQTGGFGTFLIQGHDWATPEATRHSYQLFARHVMPHFQGSLRRRMENQDWVMTRADYAKAQFTAAQDKAKAEHDATRLVSQS